MQSESGEKLNILKGQTATIKTPVPASLPGSAPAEIPLWSYNETYGMWAEEGVSKLENGFYVAEVAMLPYLSLTLPGLPETNLPDLPQREKIILPEAPAAPPARRKSFSLSAGVQGSISFVDRKLETDSFHLDLLDLRKKTERELEAIQAGLRLTVRHSSGFGLTSGVNYTQWERRQVFL